MFHFKSIKAKGFTRLSQLILICGGLVLLAPATSIAAVVDCRVGSKNNSFSYLSIDISKPVNEKNIAQTTSTHFGCSLDTFYIKLSPNKPKILGLAGVYATNLRGVGISYRINTNSQCDNRNAQSLTPDVILRCTQQNYQAEFKVDISIVKLTENYEAGLITDYPKFNATYNDQRYGFASGITINDIFAPLNSIPVEQLGCTIYTPNLNFNLGRQQQKDFTGIGPIGSGQTKQIALKCHPGTKYSLQVDGIEEPGYPGVIKLTPESGAATGVGVQLHANGQPVEFGKAKEMGQTAASGTDIKENIDITARYYQTAPTITPGSANASATYTMTYQ
ncbi:putative fimbrial subunit [Yersinia enterocolitica]|uniref:fimbrial protein n=1 Tax=Yersinia mollaretii TaxID=33060 RepID=UPI0005E11AAB|nr:fimbrial protein [Yersinia mollaretii]CNK23993.1 putative fimbrial subunit [Yersinia enterocolitica]